jgi:hypothetical protein
VGDTLPEPPEWYEELASDFIEQEIGHRDWKNNWIAWRTRVGNKSIDQIKQWLKIHKLPGDAQKVIDVLDQATGMADGVTWTGSWT